MLKGFGLADNFRQLTDTADLCVMLYMTDLDNGMAMVDLTGLSFLERIAYDCLVGYVICVVHSLGTLVHCVDHKHKSVWYDMSCEWFSILSPATLYV